jgi:hypothetical protein
MRRVLALICLVDVAGFCAHRLLRPEGFGEIGHYRSASLDEIADRKKVHQGMEVCGECHDDVLEVHQKDIHFDVKCEDCHGPGNLHVPHHWDDDGSISPDAASMPRKYTLEGCLFCHRMLSARPMTFPQIDPGEHYEFLAVKDPETRCIECHNPHEPLFLQTPVSDARIHPIISECTDCHEEAPAGDHRQAENHPVIFVCRDCHPATTRDFKNREHAFLRCTSCHLFHRENEGAGRIFKNGGSRFCVLCHEKESFKDEGRIPLIVSAEHVADEAAFQGIDPAELAADPRACLLCHLDAIHDSDLLEHRKGADDDR